MPKVSVIIPAYNVESYINKSINSVMSQSYSDWELIVVNDGSTDQTRDVIQQFLNKDDRISIIDQNNGGVSSARNRGIDAANGKYIAFLDADDFYDPNFLEHMVFSLENQRATMAFCKYREIKDGELLTETPKEVKELYKGDFIEHLFEIDKVHNISLMYNLSNLRKHNVRFREGCPNGEDRMFVIKAAYYSNVSFVPEYLYYYLYREGSASKSYMSYEKYFLMLDGYYDLEDEFKHYPQTNRTLKYLSYINKEILGVQNDLRRKIWSDLKKRDFERARQAIENYEERYQTNYDVRYKGLKRILMFPKMKIIKSTNTRLWQMLFR